jgi:hypothetical protein
VWFMPPGWRPADVARRWPKPAFEIAKVERYDPPMSRAAQGLAVLVFLALLAAATVFLWNAHTLSLAEQAAAALGMMVCLWLVGFLSERAMPAQVSVFSR